jgi:hypothetical protein
MNEPNCCVDMDSKTTERRLTVDLKTSRKITLMVPTMGPVDSGEICITITHEAKAGRLARLSVVAPASVKIGIP